MPGAGLNLVDNTFHHVAITRAARDLRLWVDGGQRYSVTLPVNATFDWAGTHGNILIGSSNSAGTTYVDEFRFTRGVARYSSTFVPTGPFPDAASATTTVGSYALEAIGQGVYVAPGDVSARATSKQVLFSTSTQSQNFLLEAIGKDTSFVVPGDTNARSASKQVLFGTTATASRYALEAIGRDNAFVVPGDVRARSASKQVLLIEPKSLLTSDYALEAIGYGTTPTPSSLYTLEAISGLPYSTPISNFALEAIAESTITPPRPQTVIVWFTVVDP